MIVACADPAGTILGTGGVGLAACGLAFEVCGPAAGAYGLFYGAIGVLLSAMGPVANCTGFAYVPQFSTGYVYTGGTAYCGSGVYALGNTAFAQENGSSFAGSGTSCNYCSRIDISLPGFPADYYGDYTSKESYWSADSNGQTIDRGDRYAGPSCQCQ
ncbi:MAG: hypothetical protein QOJ79_641 [Actinomycetota bacterium]|nr:hypothetical protein [Actinomycetota bacterium]